MNTLQAGFSRVNVTPMMGIPIRGYFKVRLADGVLDELEVNALALTAGEDTVILMSADLCYIGQQVQDAICERIEKATGLTADKISAKIIERIGA